MPSLTVLPVNVIKGLPYKVTTKFLCGYFRRWGTQGLHVNRNEEPGQHSRYSNSIRAGRFGDRIPVGARFSAPVQTEPRAHPAFYTMGTDRLYLGGRVKRSGRGVDHPPHLAPRLKVEYLYSPSEPSWPVLAWTLLFRQSKFTQLYFAKSSASAWRIFTDIQGEA
jgi:hypothetical protein